jgi:hypothetical protein
MNDFLIIYCFEFCCVFFSLGIIAVNNSLRVCKINLIRTFSVVIITN